MTRHASIKKNLIRFGSIFGITFAITFNAAFGNTFNAGVVAKAATVNAAADSSTDADEDTGIDQSALALAEARYLIQNYYVDGVSDSVINSPTIDGIVKGLNDPYSAYFTKQQSDDFVGAINNSYSGIGVYIDVDPKGIKITGVMDGAPAEAVGIKPGDIMIKADGHSLAGLSTEEAVKYIRGTENSTVAIEVLRNGKTNDFIVTRKNINAPTVVGSIVNGKTAYIRISSFGDNTPAEFKTKLDELKKSNPDSYIVDLRNNGGGYTNSAYDIAGYFIGARPVVRLTDKQNNVYVIDAKAKAETVDKPTIFLVNENSASASEILSGAVKDYKNAFFIGNVTYGKGCAQNMYQLSDGSVLKLTVMKFYSPNGNTIQKVGITPDFKVGDDLDSLSAAVLLSGDAGKTMDKRGYVRVRVSNHYFEINLSTARQSDYTDAFNYIVENCDKNEVYIGTEDGWAKASSEYANSASKLLNADTNNVTK